MAPQPNMTERRSSFESLSILPLLYRLNDLRASETVLWCGQRPPQAEWIREENSF